MIPISLLIVGLAAFTFFTGNMVSRKVQGTGASVTELSAFKQAYSEMSDYLNDTTIERRDQLKARLSARSEQISRMRNAYTGTEMDSVLGEIETAINSLLPRVDELWDLHQRTVGGQRHVQEQIDLIKVAAATIHEFIAQSNVELSRLNESAKGQMTSAERLTDASKDLRAIFDQIENAGDGQSLALVLKSRERRILRTEARLADAMPSDEAEFSNMLRERLKKLASFAPKDDQEVVDDTTLTMARQLSQELAVDLDRLDAVAATIAQSSFRQFAALGAHIQDGMAIALFQTRVNVAVNETVLELTTLMGEPTSDQASRVLESLKKMQSALSSVPGVAAAGQLRSLAQAVVEPGVASSETVFDLVKLEGMRAETFLSTAEIIDRAWAKIVAFAETQGEATRQVTERSTVLSLGTAAIAVVFSIFATFALLVSIRRPLRKLTETMKGVASGQLETEIIGTDRGDEIGAMARALGIFRSNAVEKRRFEAEAVENRKLAEAERQAADRDREAAARDIRHAIDALASGLTSVSRGELNCFVETPFAGNLDEIRLTFNAAVADMRNTLARVQETAFSVNEKSRILSSGAHDSAKQTEQQASSLEETAATIDEMTQNVTRSSDLALQTDRMATEILADVRTSGEVVAQAVHSMERISEASKKITQIIDLIDAIAFQTNLLALNAGVEAARAGEAGKGFAVVAQEVRELAQRSATAAKEISQLVGYAEQEVAGGVKSVDQTRNFIHRMNGRIMEISRSVSEIASASRDQATGLQQVNAAVGSMDQLTQRNAANAQEIHSASIALERDVYELSTMLARFQLGVDQSVAEGSAHTSPSYSRLYSSYH
ncbi:methyl-accepting chemotaxis protein [Rhizobium lemnae]|uniref:methyl-accepting chemotaxis protein n=1 Tax=Rhizobium lemnae TaxID=1214924 RepID=UPI001FF361C4|nr:HAMP domain-containing methyl-accepting chemotaxis protein [Rhizobium lemnae]MCJ8508929.1 methyl-accepting chemotaxis protein [Rhizobium lemnae]